jgi:hypothetical protein
VRSVSTAGGRAEQLMHELLTTVGDGIAAPRERVLERMSWLEFALNPLPDLFASPPGGLSSSLRPYSSSSARADALSSRAHREAS